MSSARVDPCPIGVDVEGVSYGLLDVTNGSVQPLVSDASIWVSPALLNCFAGCPLSLQRERCGGALLVQVAQLREDAVEEAARILFVTDRGRIADVEAYEIGEHGLKHQAQSLLDSRGRIEWAMQPQHLGCFLQNILTSLSCGKFFGIVHLRPSPLKLLLIGSLYLNSYGLKSIWRGTSPAEMDV
jgi:hypothetical protein